jgi:hypothetical protein
MNMTYEVLPDPTEPVQTWRVRAGEFFTTEKFDTERKAHERMREFIMGQAQPEFGERPVRAKRTVVFENEEMMLTRTDVEHEAFTFTTILGDVFTWDITRARELVQAGGANVIGLSEIPPSVLAEIAVSNEWQQAVVDKADPTQHGIAAPVVAFGQVIYILIDGTHRAVKALHDRTPFCAWMLSDKANRACLVRAREGLVP